MCGLQGFVVGRGVELGSAVVVRIVELGIVLGCDSFSLGLGNSFYQFWNRGLTWGVRLLTPLSPICVVDLGLSE